jgi:hypothetical protein
MKKMQKSALVMLCALLFWWPASFAGAMENWTGLSETSPPVVITQLNQAVAPAPQVYIISPRSEEVTADTTVTVQLQVSGTPIFKNAQLGLGPHLHLLLDRVPTESIYDLNTPITLNNLSPGTHTLQVLANKPWHESWKNPQAFAQVTFHVLAKSTDSPNAQTPQLISVQPMEVGAEPWLLDFYVANAPSHVDAEHPLRQIADWRVRATVNEQSFEVNRDEPIYLRGLRPGVNVLKLEYLNAQGQVADSAVRVVKYLPSNDGLSRLVRNELSIDQALALFDPRSRLTKAQAERSSISIPSTQQPTMPWNQEVLSMPQANQGMQSNPVINPGIQRNPVMQGNLGTYGNSGAQNNPETYDNSRVQNNPGTYGSSGTQNNPETYDNSRAQNNLGTYDNSRTQDNPGTYGNSRAQNNLGTYDNSRTQNNPGTYGNSRAQNNLGTYDNSRTQNNPGTYGNSGVQNNPGTYGNSGVQNNPGTYGDSGMQSNPGTYGDSRAQNNPGIYGNSGVQSNPGMYDNSRAQNNPETYGNSGAQNNPGMYDNSRAQNNPETYGNSGAQNNPGMYGNSGVQSNSINPLSPRSTLPAPSKTFSNSAEISQPKLPQTTAGGDSFTKEPIALAPEAIDPQITKQPEKTIAPIPKVLPSSPPATTVSRPSNDTIAKADPQSLPSVTNEKVVDFQVIGQELLHTTSVKVKQFTNQIPPLVSSWIEKFRHWLSDRMAAMHTNSRSITSVESTQSVPLQE